MSRASSGVIRSPRFHDRREDLVHRTARGPRARPPACGDRQLQQPCALLRPNLETLEAFRRYAQHPTDDSKGQRLCNVPDEIEARRRGDALQQLRSDGPYPWFERLDRPGCKRLVDQPSKPRVFRRIDQQPAGNIPYTPLYSSLKLISDNTLSFVPTISPQISPTGPGKAALFGIKRLSKTF